MELTQRVSNTTEPTLLFALTNAQGKFIHDHAVSATTDKFIPVNIESTLALTIKGVGRVDVEIDTIKFDWFRATKNCMIGFTFKIESCGDYFQQMIESDAHYVLSVRKALNTESKKIIFSIEPEVLK